MIDLIDYGFDASMARPGDMGLPARVTAVQKERYELVCPEGETYGRLKAGVYYGAGSESFPTTGDFVLIDYNDSGDSMITKTLDRRSYFSRRDPTPGRGEQAVAANFDTVFVMASLNQNFNLRRLERYLTLAWQSGAVPAVVLTKADLADGSEAMLVEAERIAPGVAVHIVSARTGTGLDTLSPYLLPRKTLVFLGSSGIGKSSLLNALAGEELMDVAEIREQDGRGRHTTTCRQLVMLKSGAMIIDTPGMRELGLWDVRDGLGGAFQDVEACLGRCRFSDCRHETEPGCAVLQAIEDGTLSQERWDSYQKLKKEARFAEDKAAAMREREAWGKDISKKIKQLNKEIW
jgi:ribosome biogenesis GTPase